MLVYHLGTNDAHIVNQWTRTTAWKEDPSLWNLHGCQWSTAEFRLSGMFSIFIRSANRSLLFYFIHTEKRQSTTTNLSTTITIINWSFFSLCKIVFLMILVDSLYFQEFVDDYLFSWISLSLSLSVLCSISKLFRLFVFVFLEKQ